MSYDVVLWVHTCHENTEPVAAAVEGDAVHTAPFPRVWSSGVQDATATDTAAAAAPEPWDCTWTAETRG